MKYQVIEKKTGKVVSDYPWLAIVTPEGNVAWWDDNQGWEVEAHQEFYEVKLLTE